MNAFEYLRADTIDLVAERLAADPDGTRLLAGGTDLLVWMVDGKLAPRTVIDVKSLAELRGIRANGGAKIGGLTSMRALERDPLLRRRYTALAAGAGEIGSVQIRNRATLGGNLGTASPAADTPPALLAYGARLTVHGPGGRRTLPLADFFTAPGRHSLAPGELIVSVELPALPERSGSSYLKLASRKAMDIAFVGVAAWVGLNADGTVADAAVGLGAVAPTPRAVPGLGDLLRGRALNDEALEAAAHAAMAACSPISDQRASAEYRRAMVGVLAKRTLRHAAAQAEGR